MTAPDLPPEQRELSEADHDALVDTICLALPQPHRGTCNRVADAVAPTVARMVADARAEERAKVEAVERSPMSESSEAVWVLSEGEYSDYRVICACPSEAEATALARKMNAGKPGHEEDVRVESLPWADSSTEQVEILSMRITLWDDGTETDARTTRRVAWPFDATYDDDYLPVRWRWARPRMHHDKGGRLEVSGTDHERVRKVFSDRRAALKCDDALRAKGETQGLT